MTLAFTPAEYQPFAWRWKHVDDDCWYYGGELPRSLRPYTGQTLIGSHFIEPLFNGHQLQSLNGALNASNSALYQAQEAAKALRDDADKLRAEADRAWAEVDRCAKQMGDLTTIRIQDELTHGNIMGRIAAHLLGSQNNVTDEEVVAAAASIGGELLGARERIKRLEALVPSNRTCAWHQDGEDSEVWQTKCGHLFEINNEETPTENGFAHCCFCGGKLEQHIHEREDDQDE